MSLDSKISRRIADHFSNDKIRPFQAWKEHGMATELGVEMHEVTNCRTSFERRKNEKKNPNSLGNTD